MQKALEVELLLLFRETHIVDLRQEQLTGLVNRAPGDAGTLVQHLDKDLGRVQPDIRTSLRDEFLPQSKVDLAVNEEAHIYLPQ